MQQTVGLVVLLLPHVWWLKRLQQLPHEPQRRDVLKTGPRHSPIKFPQEVL